MTTAYDTIDSPLGELLLVGARSSLTGLYMQEGRRPGEIGAGWRRAREPLAEAREQLGEYFAGERTDFDLAVSPAGSAFERRVWAELHTIPYGATLTYGELAARIGRPNAARAVGAANGRNPIAVVTPCHRIVGGGGALTGYAGGIDRKRFLLALEAGVSGERGPTR